MNQRIDPEPTFPDNVTIRPEHNVRRSNFLSLIGNRAYCVLQEDCLPDNPNSRPIPHLMTKFEPPGLAPAYQLLFSQRLQRRNESAMDLVHALQALAHKCEFGAFRDLAILQQLRAGVRDPGVRRKLLSDEQLNLDSKTILLAEEALAEQEHTLARHPVDFSNHVSKHLVTPRVQGVALRLHDYRTCPAKEWECYRCHKKGHIARMWHIANPLQPPVSLSTMSRGSPRHKRSRKVQKMKWKW